MNTLKVRRRKIANVLAGEPWIYQNALLEGGDEPGVHQVCTEDGQHIGYADVNRAAPTPARLLSRDEQWVGDERWVQDLLLKAIERRLRLGYHFQASGMRLVNGEGDGLPGLVIDCFGTCVVIDIYSRGMRERIPFIQAFFSSHLPHMRPLVRMSQDAAKREAVEAIEPESYTASFCEQAVRFDIPIGSGQKTGFYLDQRENRRLITQWARGKSVLDLFCYHGAFALSALANGARAALGIDSSGPALEVAAAHAQRNGLDIELAQADVFDQMNALIEVGPFDIIICDPPKLAPNKRSKRKALKAYRFLIDRCLKALAEHGILLVSSCSQAIDHEDLRLLLQQEARSQGCQLDVVAQTGHPADHPWPVAFTTGRYLSTLIVERR